MGELIQLPLGGALAVLVAIGFWKSLSFGRASDQDVSKCLLTYDSELGEQRSPHEAKTA
jgi:hypothetical protein